MWVFLCVHSYLFYGRWYCAGSPDAPHRSRKVSPLANTFFGRTQIEWRKFCKIFYCFLSKIKVTEVLRQCSVNSKTAVQWYTYIREALSTVAWHSFERIGKDETYCDFLLMIKITFLST